MAVKIQITDILNFYAGSTSGSNIYLGSNLVWSALDPDAQAYITAAGIVNPTLITATNNLVLAMKAQGLWTKCLAVYPMLGGIASSVKYNLINPLDTDAAHRLTFTGGWNFENAGIYSDGLNTSWADTNFSTSTPGFSSSVHMLMNINQQGAERGYDIGSADGGDWALIARYSNDTAYAAMGADGYLGTSSSDAVGTWVGTHDGTNTRYLYKNSTQIGSQNAGLNPTGVTLFLGNVRVGSFGADGTNNRYSFVSFGTYLNATEVTNYTSIINTFNTAVGR